jgi:hypothetical protein
VSTARDQFCDVLQIQIEVWRNGTFRREQFARFAMLVNHIWAIDFVHDRLSNGRSYKMTDS